MNQVIITGAGGFVGKNLTLALVQAGCRVYAVAHKKTGNTEQLENLPNVYVLYSDSENVNSKLKSLCTEKIDVFYHLAWDGGTKNSQITIDQQFRNIEMSIQYLELAKQIGCQRFIGIGTVSEYLTYQWPIVEHPRILYATTKDYTGKILSHLARSSPQIEFVWCRFASTYGIFDTSNNLVNYTVKQLLAGQSPEYTAAVEPYNFCYIKDCINALIKIGNSEHVANRPVFIGGPETAPLHELLTIIQKKVAPEIPLRFGARKSDGIIYYEEWFSLDILKDEYGYLPEYPLSRGINELIQNWA